MDILSNPIFAIVPFAIWMGLMAAALHSLGSSGEGFAAPFRCARTLLDEHLTRGDIDREEYVDRRKGLDDVTGII